MLTLINNAKEGRPAAAYNISRAFLYCDMDDFVTQVVDDISVDMLLRSNPEYKEFVYVTKSKKVHLHLKKAMYGTLRAARLFYER